MAFLRELISYKAFAYETKDRMVLRLYLKETVWGNIHSLPKYTPPLQSDAMGLFLEAVVVSNLSIMPQKRGEVISFKCLILCTQSSPVFPCISSHSSNRSSQTNELEILNCLQLYAWTSSACLSPKKTGLSEFGLLCTVSLHMESHWAAEQNANVEKRSNQC